MRAASSRSIPDWATDAVYYLNSGDGTIEERESFAWAAILAKCGGGDVDLDEKIIFDNSFLNNQKVKCIYEKLKNSESYKNLILDTFGEDGNIKLKYSVAENLPAREDGTQPNGNCSLISGGVNITTGQLENSIIEIKIRKGYIQNSSALAVAKTIMHEGIHAFLMIKYYGCNQGASFGEFDDVELSEMINEYYLSACPGQEQHEFMFDFMMPTMSTILSQIKDSLVPTNHQEMAENDYALIDENNPDGGSVPWSWPQFYSYFSILGLHETNAFINNIQSTPSKLANFNTYANIGLNGFKKECND